jgi:hypothetical protein
MLFFYENLDIPEGISRKFNLLKQILHAWDTQAPVHTLAYEPEFWAFSWRKNPKFRL